jgi:hypothetical protein
MKVGDIYSLGTNGVWETYEFSVPEIASVSTIGYWQGHLFEMNKMFYFNL